MKKLSFDFVRNLKFLTLFVLILIFHLKKNLYAQSCKIVPGIYEVASFLEKTWLLEIFNDEKRFEFTSNYNNEKHSFDWYDCDDNDRQIMLCCSDKHCDIELRFSECEDRQSCESDSPEIFSSLSLLEDGEVKLVFYPRCHRL